jgi:hypothetical protein
MGVTLMLEFTFAPSFLTTIAIVLLRGLSAYQRFQSECRDITCRTAPTMKTLRLAHLQDDFL